MVFQWRKGTLWGIAAGSFIVVLVAGSIAIISFRRMRQRQHVKRMFVATEGGVTGLPRVPFNITDEDIARMPGIRKTLRNSLQSPQRPLQGWTNITSQEDITERPTSGKKPEIIQSSQESSRTTYPPPSWPLSPRLRRSKLTPPVKVKMTPLNCANKGHVMMPPTELVSSSQNFSRKASGKKLPKVSENQRMLDLDAFNTLALKPKPLFYDRQRSVSNPILARKSEEHKLQSDVLVNSGSHNIRKSSLPRSTSLYSQTTSAVPSQPVPPLPLNMLPSIRPQDFQCLTEASSKRTSRTSLLSGDTSILFDGASRSLLQVETDLSSIDVFSPPIPSSNSMGPGIWNDDMSPRKSRICFSDPLMKRKLFPDSDNHIYLRNDYVSSLPRSASSGLSMSLLDHVPSRNLSSNSLRTEQPSPATRSTLMVPRSAKKDSIIGRRNAPASPLRNSVVFGSCEEFKGKRASTSILQCVSGNEGSPLHEKLEKRPSSIATSDPFQWDSETSMQPDIPSAMKGRVKGHKRQTGLKIKNTGGSDVCISNIPSTVFSSEILSNRTETGTEVHSKAAALCVDNLQRQPPTPPSSLDFDPKISTFHQSRASKGIGEVAYLPNLAKTNLYNFEFDSSTESVVSTPTRTPAMNRPSGANPNRHKSVFSGQGSNTWSLFTPNAKLRDKAEPICDPEKNQDISSESPSTMFTFAENSPTSFLFPIPPADLPSWRRRPTSQIYGPRALPTRRSPLRRIEKANNSSPSTDLRKSIAALRRNNSEARGLHPELHKRFLSISGTEDSITEDELERSDRYEPVDTSIGNKQGIVNGPRDMPFVFDGNSREWRTPERQRTSVVSGSPGTMYDTDGFLKE